MGRCPKPRVLEKGAADATKEQQQKMDPAGPFFGFLFAFDFGVKGLAPCSRNTLEEVLHSE